MKLKRILLLNIVWIALALAACSSQEAPLSQVSGATEEKQPVQAFGAVKALTIKDISVDFPVKIEKLQVKEGQAVSGGETLAVIDMDEAERTVRLMEDRIKALKLETDVKQKVYAQKKESILKDRNPNILKLKNALEKTEKAYDKLLTDNDTKSSLYNAGALTGKDLLEYENSVEAAGYACKDAELNLKSLQDTLHAELLQAEADINSALRDISVLEIELQDSRQNLSSSNLKGNDMISDIARGIICSVECKPGDTVPAGGKLLSIMDASSFIIEVNVDEQFIKDVKPGAKAYIVPEFDRSLECKGEVSVISAFAIQQNGETVIPVEIKPEKQCEWLKPGYNTEVAIEVE
jgi:HlyD family secretion protein